MTSEVQAAAATGSASASESALGRVEAHGSAREGAGHWWQERLSSLATFLLWVWFAVSLLRLPSYDHATIAEWLGSPLAAVPMLLLIAATFWHLRMGMQVIVDDYVHDEGAKLFSTALIGFASVLGAAFALFSVLKLALGGDAG
ncbi:MAG TPA: succinate dehydrogenase, hydrophobic membrane anchor protein [Allosphingosinicella sp.]|jgi:succinate dehydrogenase / fumarate reductase membrane anchor subunit